MADIPPPEPSADLSLGGAAMPPPPPKPQQPAVPSGTPKAAETPRKQLEEKIKDYNGREENKDQPLSASPSKNDGINIFNKDGNYAGIWVYGQVNPELEKDKPPSQRQTKPFGLSLTSTNPSQPPQKEGSQQIPPSNGTAPSTPNAKGARGPNDAGNARERVRDIQNMLKDHGYGGEMGEVDGKFGKKTKQALHDYLQSVQDNPNATPEEKANANKLGGTVDEVAVGKGKWAQSNKDLGGALDKATEGDVLPKADKSAASADSAPRPSIDGDKPREGHGGHHTGHHRAGHHYGAPGLHQVAVPPASLPASP